MILSGDCRDTLKQLPAGSVQLCMSSPPYWALRSYLPKDHPLKALEIGSEPTPELFIDNLMAVYDQVRRVLRDDGVCVVNLGETWNAYNGNRGDSTGVQKTAHEIMPDLPTGSGLGCDGLAAGNVVGIPFRFAFAMQQRGWVWRDTVIWRKPSAMPSSVNGWRWERCKVKVATAKFTTERQQPGKTGENYGHRDCGSFATDENKTTWQDCPGCAKCAPGAGYVLSKGSLRTTTAHEYLFIFAKGMGYYADRDGWATPAKQASRDRYQYSFGGKKNEHLRDGDNPTAIIGDREPGATANLRSVIDVSAQPMKHAHYAAYPEELCIPFIKAFTSERGCCPACGSPWARVVNAESVNLSGSGKSGNLPAGKGREDGQVREGNDLRMGVTPCNQTLGWRQTCDCPAHEPVPCTVLDPFGGSGRTAIAAQMLGRDAILCELNPAYIDIAQRQAQETAPLLLSHTDTP